MFSKLKNVWPVILFFVILIATIPFIDRNKNLLGHAGVVPDEQDNDDESLQVLVGMLFNDGDEIPQVANLALTPTPSPTPRPTLTPSPTMRPTATPSPSPTPKLIPVPTLKYLSTPTPTTTP